jgi:hypothetical protein
VEEKGALRLVSLSRVCKVELRSQGL